jgi:DNA polymerase/3'-5' exonuclease PolX
VSAPSNVEIANQLERLAGLLEEQGAPAERTGAWRAASRTLRTLRRPVVELLDREGVEALASLPGVGCGLAMFVSAIVQSAPERAALAS